MWNSQRKRGWWGVTVHQVISDWNTPKNLAPFLTGLCPHRDRHIIGKAYAFSPTALHLKIRTKSDFLSTWKEAEALEKQVQRPTAWKTAAAKLPSRWPGRSPVFVWFDWWMSRLCWRWPWTCRPCWTWAWMCRTRQWSSRWLKSRWHGSRCQWSGTFVVLSEHRILSTPFGGSC